MNRDAGDRRSALLPRPPARPLVTGREHRVPWRPPCVAAEGAGGRDRPGPRGGTAPVAAEAAGDSRARGEVPSRASRYWLNPCSRNAKQPAVLKDHLRSCPPVTGSPAGDGPARSSAGTRCLPGGSGQDDRSSGERWRRRSYGGVKLPPESRGCAVRGCLMAARNRNAAPRSDADRHDGPGAVLDGAGEHDHARRLPPVPAGRTFAQRPAGASPAARDGESRSTVIPGARPPAIAVCQGSHPERERQKMGGRPLGRLRVVPWSLPGAGAGVTAWVPAWSGR